MIKTQTGYVNDVITNQKKLLVKRRTNMKFNQVHIGDDVIVNEKKVEQLFT